MKTQITIFTFLLVNTLKVSANQPYDPRDFIHLNWGCPENSICSKQVGKTSSQFNKSLNGGFKNTLEFFKKHGLPINAYREADPSKKDNLGINYNSSCEQHRKINLFYTANFVKSANSEKNLAHIIDSKPLTIEETLHYRPVYLLRKGNAVPINVGVLDYPSFIDGDSIGLVGEFKENYFQYSVNLNQEINLLNSKYFTNDKVIQTKQMVECPQEFSSVKTPKFFTARFCKNLLNIKTNKIETVLDFKACN